MNKIWVIYKREIWAIIHAPFSAVLGTCFIGILGYTFSYYLTAFSQVDFYPVILKYMANLLLITVPFLTMGLLAGEAERNSISLLLSSPISEWSIVIGKWAAVFTAVTAILCLSIPFPLILTAIGSPDTGPIVGGYVGIVLLGGLFTSAGLFSSSLTKSPVIGAIGGFAIMLFLGIAEQAEGFLGQSTLGSFFKHLSYMSPCKALFGGVIYGYHIVYFVTATFFFLFATQRVLSSNRWR